MKLDDLCMRVIKEKLAETREQVNRMAHRCQMGEAIALDDWEPISVLFDDTDTWIHAYAEFRVVCDIARDSKRGRGHG